MSELYPWERTPSPAQLLGRKSKTVKLLADLATHRDEQIADVVGVEVLAHLRQWHAEHADEIQTLHKVQEVHPGTYENGQTCELLAVADRLIDDAISATGLPAGGDK